MPHDCSNAGPCGQIADVIVHVQCAHTSLGRLAELGLLDRERALLDRLPTHFGRVILVTYGGADEQRWVREAVPSAPAGGVELIELIANVQGLEPAIFQSQVPGRVAAAIARGGRAGGTAIVHTDQHLGGDVGVAITRELRRLGVRTGLVARGGYPWAWSDAAESGPESVRALRSGVLERELCHAADVVVGTTKRMVVDLAVRHGLPHERFQVVPNFVRLDGPPAGLREREPNLVLYAGRLGPEKRVHLLIDAVAAVRERVPGVRLLIHGQGPLEAELRRQIEHGRVPAEIRPRVPHSELAAVMRRCRVYAQCSAYEGHPKTIIEAMAQGAPTLVTRATGVDDEIVPEQTGIVVRDRVEDIAEGLFRLLTDDVLAERVGAQAASDVRARLSFEAIEPKFVRAWRLAMERAGTGAVVPVVGVRWDQALLNAEPEASGREFAGAITAFVRRLSPIERERFRRAMDEELAQLDELAAASRR